MPLEISQYTTTPVYDLLSAAAQGRVGIDHRFLHAILDRPELAVPDLVRFGLEDHEQDPINLEEDLLALFHTLRTPEALPYYLKLVREQPEEVPEELIEALQVLGGQAITPLVSLYDELGEEMRTEIPFLLASLGEHDPRVFEVLRRHFEFDQADGAFCLGLYGDPAAKPLLEDRLRALDSNDPAVASQRRDLTDALDEIDRPREPYTPEPLDLWELYPEEAPPAFDVLSDADRLEFFESDNPEYRLEAAASFFNRELSSPAEKRLLRVAETDADERVRARCWEALGAASDDPKVHDALLKRLIDRSAPPVERAGALVGLAQDEDEALRAYMVEFYQIPEVRAKAMEAMWRSLDRTLAQYFPKHLTDSDLEVRRQAVWGVGYLGIGAEAGRIRELFRDDDLRADSLFAYALCVPAEISRGRVRGLLRRIDEEAGGLTPMETELVQQALDERLALHGQPPVFQREDGEEAPVEDLVDVPKTGRNDACPCGSGKKYKKCHGA